MPTVPDPDSVRATGKNAFTVIEGEGIEEMPELPDIYIDVEYPSIDDEGKPTTILMPELLVWHAEVQRAWKAIWESPWRDEFQPADLAGMHSAMLLLNAFYKSPKAAYLTEFRMWCNEFGLTPSARRKMRITIGPKDTGGKKGAGKSAAKNPRKDPRLK